MTVTVTVGRVKWFDHKKGWGFILNDEVGDVFLHFSNIDPRSIDRNGWRTVADGEEITYELHKREKGYEARNAVPASLQSSA